MVTNWRSHQLVELQQSCSTKGIFNLDKAALSYEMLLSQIFAHKGSTWAGVKQRRDVVMLVFGASATGKEKLPFLIIVMAHNPICFRKVQLPGDVQYTVHITAWMMVALFEEYVCTLDDKFAKDSCRGLFIVDSRPGYRKIEKLGAMRMELLPPNMTSTLPPMDRGLIKSITSTKEESTPSCFAVT